MFKKMPFILIFIIAALFCFSSHIPLEAKQFLYGLSITIKSLIGLILPFIIFGLLFKTTVGFASRASFIMLFILLAVCCSNAFSTILSHFVGSWIYHLDFSVIKPKESGEGLSPLWNWQFPSLIANNKAMFLGIFLGIFLEKIKPELAHQLSETLNGLLTRVLNCFLFLIPAFVAGYVVKLQADGVMSMIIKDYTLIFIIIALAQYSYILFSYAFLSGFKGKAFLTSVKNMLPAALAGFSTLSSAAVMPLTIQGAERNAKNKDLSRSIVPATVNIHLVGDCFAIPIFAYAIMKSFGMPEPSLINYLIFVFYFVIAKFSVAAIPGGGIIVMLPVLQSCLGFNAEMSSLITALYILFDPVVTCANVLGNGAFAKLIDRIYSLRLSKVNQLAVE